MFMFKANKNNTKEDDLFAPVYIYDLFWYWQDSSEIKMGVRKINDELSYDYYDFITNKPLDINKLIAEQRFIPFTVHYESGNTELKGNVKKQIYDINIVKVHDIMIPVSGYYDLGGNLCKFYYVNESAKSSNTRLVEVWGTIDYGNKNNIQKIITYRPKDLEGSLMLDYYDVRRIMAATNEAYKKAKNAKHTVENSR